MKDWSTALRDSTVSGAVASALSTAALIALSQRESRNPWRGTNDISHWVWGEPAFAEKRLDWAHTGLGYGIHHVSSMLWSAVFEKFFGDRASEGKLAQALGGGLLVAGLACFIDYKLTPKRLQPGIERHLSTPAMALFYGAFGLALAATGVARALSGRKTWRS
ncbi:MAG: hypothetical protein JWP36_1945 [Paucimonas sp.]|nr:hypothetical protein [Paucimonas sp.]